MYTTTPPYRTYRTYRASLNALAAAGRGTIASILFVVALANVATALLTQPWQQATAMEGIIDLDSYGLGRAGALLMGALLVVLAHALMRGKRHAWLLSIGLLLFSLISTLASGGRLGYIVTVLALLILLLALAPLFSTRSDPRAMRLGYIALGLSIICFLVDRVAYHAWHSQIIPGALTPRLEILYALRLLLFLFLGFGVVEVLRPVLSARRLYRDEVARVRDMASQYGRLATIYFALSADKSYFWSASGQSVIAYRLAHRVALVLGDPIGPAYECEQVMREFSAYCKRQDWLLALYQASEPMRVICRRLGMQSHKIGEEAVVDVSRFTTAGKIGAPVRHSIARARRDDITIRCWQGEAPPEAIFAGMKRISQAWLSEHNTQMQMRFSMGAFPADWSEELLTAVALDAQGEVQAFVTWTPLFGGQGWSLDIIRRLKDTVPGTMEYLIAESIAWARERGAIRMTLGLAPLAGLDDGARSEHAPASLAESDLRPIRSSSWLERSASFLHRRKLLLGNYASLYAFKAKFQPDWESRYLVVSDTSALPRVFAALLKVHGWTWWGMLEDTWVQRTRTAKSTKSSRQTQTAQANAA